MLVIYSFIIYISSDVTNQWYWDYSISPRLNIPSQSRQEVSHGWVSLFDADIHILNLATTRLAWSLMRDEQENSFSDFRVCGTLISVVWLLLWMRQTNWRLDTGSEDQLEAGRDGGPWQPPRVTVSQSPCPGSSLWHTPDQNRWGRANCSCHLPKSGGIFISWGFLIFNCQPNIFWNTYFLSFTFQTRGFHLFYNIMRPGARRHSIAVGLSSSSGSGPGGW